MHHFIIQLKIPLITILTTRIEALVGHTVPGKIGIFFGLYDFFQSLLGNIPQPIFIDILADNIATRDHGAV